MMGRLRAASFNRRTHLARAAREGFTGEREEGTVVSDALNAHMDWSPGRAKGSS